jgi:coenzyme F420 hydrogenase subunit beta
MTHNFVTVSEVANHKLCNTCGGCKWICPHHAIEFNETIGGYFFPKVSYELCTMCGLCVSICPGVGFCESLITAIPKDPFVGDSLGAFVGRANDEKIYQRSQSGGIVSALLASTLASDEISGATVVVMEAGMPPRAVVKIARDIEAIIGSQKSKYCPVPLLSILKEIEDSDKPIAVVGLSCHLHGLFNILDLSPHLKHKIAFTIGLICDRVMTYAAVDYLIEKSKISNLDTILYFRDKMCTGYPGDVRVVSRSGESVCMPASERHRIKDLLTPARCRICFDKMNIFADLTIGDPHGIEGVDRKFGESLLIVRTKKGERIVKAAENSGFLNIRKINYESAHKGQAIWKKKKHWGGFAQAWIRTGSYLPNYCHKIMKLVPQQNGKKYIHELNRSLDLDLFDSRKLLLEYVRSNANKKLYVDQLVAPGRYAFRIIRWVLRKILKF